MRTFYILFMVMVLILCSCQSDTDRKIRLAPQSPADVFSRQAQSIQLAAAKKLGVAIFPFINKSGNADLDWMCQGFAEMLITQFSQFSKLNLNPSRQTQVALSRMGMQDAALTPEQTTQVGKILNAGILITGDYDLVDDKIALKVNLHDVESGRVIQSITRTTPESSELFAVVDDIIMTFRDTISNNVDYAQDNLDLNQASITTKSVDAFAFYSKAMEAHASFDHEGTVENLKKAIELDSTFATALAAMGDVYMTKSNFKLAKEYYKKALKQSDVISPQERLKIHAGLDFVNMDFSNAIAKYEKLAEMYPEDKELHYQLGSFYFSIFHNYEKAAQAYRATLALDPEHKLALNQLSYCLSKMGREKESYKFLNDYIALAPNEANPFDSYGEILQSFGHLDDAIKMFDKALEINKDYFPARMHKILAYIAAGKSRAALRMVKREKKGHKDSAPADIYRAGAFAELALGHPDKAVRWIKEYLENGSHKASFLFLLNQIDPDNDMLLHYFHEWLQDTASLRERNINEVLNYAILSLYLNDSMEKMQKILQAQMATVSDPIFRQAGLSTLQSLQFYTGIVDVQTTTELMDYSDTVNQMGALTSSWESYWYTFFKAAQHAYQHGKIDKSYFLGMQQWASQGKKHELEFFSQIGLANLYQLDGDMDKALEIIYNLSTPFESDWSVIGPFEIKEDLLEAFWPEKSPIDEWFVDAQARGLWINSTDALLDGYLNLGQMTDASFNNSVYAVLPITVSTIQDCQLRFGINGSLKIWLNNRLVSTTLTTDQCTFDDQIYSVRLSPGTNWLMVRVSHIFKDMGFYFRVTDSDGNPLEHIDFTRHTTS